MLVNLIVIVVLLIVYYQSYSYIKTKIDSESLQKCARKTNIELKRTPCYKHDLLSSVC